ncbi:MAG: hypothetical protein ACI9XP_000287 [Lentimonas sp.]|jgi:hypothetical protein
MILFLVDRVNERWVYTLDFVFSKRGINYYVTSEVEQFKNSKLPKVNLCKSGDYGGLKFRVSDLLYDQYIKEYVITQEVFANQKCLAFNGIPDLFASIFFVLSRMEEYILNERDHHERFSAKSSFQKRFDWLEQCICDRWAICLINQLNEKLDIELKVELADTKVIPTFDIDNVFAYQFKEGSRKWLSIARDVAKLDKNRIRERKRVLKNNSADPYDTFSYIESISDRGFDVRIFWLTGEYAQFDKNVSIEHDGHQEVIRKMAEKAQIGIHPSYKSNQLKFNVKIELNNLQNVLGQSQKVTASRQHYLKIDMPSTYKNLLKYGLKEDYSMGFADQAGFRMGTAHSVNWFDLSQNTISNLVLKPFAYMDGSLNEYMHLTPQEAMAKVAELYKEVRTYGGDFIFIWHNETIGDYKKWKGWNEVLEFTLDLKKT